MLRLPGNGVIDGIHNSLCNIYAPNDDDPLFIRRVLGSILDRCTRVLIAGGDMNCVMSQLKAYLRGRIMAFSSD